MDRASLAPLPAAGAPLPFRRDAATMGPPDPLARLPGGHAMAQKDDLAEMNIFYRYPMATAFLFPTVSRASCSRCT